MGKLPVTLASALCSSWFCSPISVSAGGKGAGMSHGCELRQRVLQPLYAGQQRWMPVHLPPSPWEDARVATAPSAPESICADLHSVGIGPLRQPGASQQLFPHLPRPSALRPPTHASYKIALLIYSRHKATPAREASHCGARLVFCR